MNASAPSVQHFIADLDVYVDEQGRRQSILPGFSCQCLLVKQHDPIVAYDARPIIGQEPLRCGARHRVGFACLTDEGAAVLATAGKFLVIETRIVGEATVVPGSFDRAIYRRSEREIDSRLSELRKLGTDASGWSTLYEDRDGQLWELSYPIGEMHGGGPRRLARLDSRGVAHRYPRFMRPEAPQGRAGRA